MTPVTSAAKVMGQLRRWFTGEDDTAESHHSVEDISRHCPTCTCNRTQQYRGRSNSDCFSTQCRDHCRDMTATRERSCSVNSRQAMSERRHSSRSYETMSWSSGRQLVVREVLEEDGELCRCTGEPVCCCERCFLYVDEQTADVRDRVVGTEAVVNFSSLSSSAETRQLASGQSAVLSTASSHNYTRTSTTDCLPPSIPVSLDGEEGYAKSQQHLRWARRQRLLDDELTSSSCPPPNRTICHVVDCW